MNLKDILAISGEGTLFRFIAQGKNAVIVENLETARRISAGPSAKVSALEEIAIYTSGEDLPLGKVMDMIWDLEQGGEAPSHKQGDAVLKEYFASAVPEYDRERVYTSDIKKVLNWYNQLHKLNLLIKEEEEQKEEAEEKGEEKTQEASAEGKTATVKAEKETKGSKGKKASSTSDES